MIVFGRPGTLFPVREKQSNDVSLSCSLALVQGDQQRTSVSRVTVSTLLTRLLDEVQPAYSPNVPAAGSASCPTGATSEPGLSLQATNSTQPV